MAHHEVPLARLPEGELELASEGSCTPRFARDGSLLAAFDGGGTLSVWDVATRKQRWSAKPGAGQPGGFALKSLLFSPDGKTLVASAPGRIATRCCATASSFTMPKGR